MLRRHAEYPAPCAPSGSLGSEQPVPLESYAKNSLAGWNFRTAKRGRSTEQGNCASAHHLRLMQPKFNKELPMAVMIVKEISGDGERIFELNRERVQQIKETTGLDELTIYTVLNSGQPLEDANRRWIMVRQ
jgi:hypothetical protein